MNVLKTLHNINVFDNNQFTDCIQAEAKSDYVIFQ